MFDEGHTVKNPAAVSTKAAIALTADRRWCCTGTPLSSSVEDLVGQCAAIHLQPLATKPFFDNHIKTTFATSHSDVSANRGSRGGGSVNVRKVDGGCCRRGAPASTAAQQKQQQEPQRLFP